MLTFTLLCKYMIFLFFGRPQLAFFSSKLYDNSFAKSEQIYNNNNDNHNNQCEEVSWKDIQVKKNKLTFMKKAVLHETTVMHCKGREILRNLFNTN